jgi:regulation of enolase protein 1 (concanavalin A-like superfamily)
MVWLNEPPVWTANEDAVELQTANEGDFWQKTHYGFVHDNGHFFHQTIASDFTISVRVIAEFEALYDQAGLMIRIDSENWIKCGIEYFGGKRHFSVVATRGYSDWSVQEWPHDGSFWVKAVRKGDALAVLASIDGRSWSMVRLCYLPSGCPVQAGPMACSPTRSGLRVRFEAFAVGDPEPFEA